MKIEKQIIVIYSIVTSEGARLEVSDTELLELYKEIGKITTILAPSTVQRAVVLSDTKLAPATATVKKDIWSQGEY